MPEQHDLTLHELTGAVHGCADAVDALRDLLLAKLEAQTDAIIAADKRYEQRFAAQEGAVAAALTAQGKAVEAALTAADRSVSKVEIATDKRFDSMRNEVDIHFNGINDKIEAARVAKEMRHEQFRQEIQALREIQSSTGGKGAGLNAAWGYLIQLVTLLGALGIGLFVGRK